MFGLALADQNKVNPRRAKKKIIFSMVVENMKHDDCRTGIARIKWDKETEEGKQRRADVARSKVGTK